MTASPSHERRRIERRRVERRRPLALPTEDSWFGALADVGQGASAPWPQGPDVHPDAGPDADRPGLSDSRFLAREAQRIVSSEGTALRRVFRAYVAARAALGAALLVAPWAMALMGARPPLGLVLACLAYAGQSLSLWLLGGPVEQDGTPPERLRRRQWVMTIGVDLLVFSALHLMDSSQPLNYSALLALPVLMAGVMTKRLAALATAAFVALVLLGGAWRQALLGADSVRLLSQAALAGVGAFVITLISSELAQRLAREERAARGSLDIARQQAQLNRLVLEEMAEGVLVIDRRLRVRAANPAARVMLGVDEHRLTMPFPLQGEAGWRSLFEAVEQSFALGHWPDHWRELKLGAGASRSRIVQVRARFTRRDGFDAASDQPEDVCVLFLEDMRQVQARVRQEKLAAMGRMSAGISHEIRNPLAAIAQANALMIEDELAVPQRRLAQIIEDNVQRLKRIVDDVLAVSPSEVTSVHAVDAVALVRQICQDWLLTHDPSGSMLQRVVLRLPAASAQVLFDPDHLRRVLMNLLDNAGRHATQTDGAVIVELRPHARSAVALTVASDGPPMAADVERHLFEPFFSTRSRGTGLGLYICRELCERYAATIDFRPGGTGERHSNLFRVVMRSASPR